MPAGGDRPGLYQPVVTGPVCASRWWQARFVPAGGNRPGLCQSVVTGPVCDAAGDKMAAIQRRSGAGSVSALSTPLALHLLTLAAQLTARHPTTR